MVSSHELVRLGGARAASIQARLAGRAGVCSRTERAAPPSISNPGKPKGLTWFRQVTSMAADYPPLPWAGACLWAAAKL